LPHDSAAGVNLLAKMVLSAIRSILGSIWLWHIFCVLADFSGSESHLVSACLIQEFSLDIFSHTFKLLLTTHCYLLRREGASLITLFSINKHFVAISGRFWSTQRELHHLTLGNPNPFRSNLLPYTNSPNFENTYSYIFTSFQHRFWEFNWETSREYLLLLHQNHLSFLLQFFINLAS